MEWVREMIRRYKRELVLFILFFLISSASFALGYLAARELTPPQIVIEKNTTY